MLKLFRRTRAPRSTTRTGRIVALRAITTLAMTLLVTACGVADDTKNRYPIDWPKLNTKVTLFTRGQNCPDLTGTYAYAPNGNGSAFGIRSTVLGDGVKEEYNAPWRTISIAGDINVALTITVTRPSMPTGGPASAPVTRSNTLLHGTQYTCKDGWLVGMPRDMSILRSGRQEAVEFQRDTSGGLVARAHIREFRVFSLWAETGAGIPYWSDMRTYWARWDSGTMLSPTVAAGRATRDELQKMSRLERQIYERETGIEGSSAGNRPAATTASDTREHARRLDFKEVKALVERRIDRNASLEDFRHDGMRYLVKLRVNARGQVTRTLENFNEEAEFVDVRDDTKVGDGQSEQIATISFRSRN